MELKPYETEPDTFKAAFVEPEVDVIKAAYQERLVLSVKATLAEGGGLTDEHREIARRTRIKKNAIFTVDQLNDLITTLEDFRTRTLRNVGALLENLDEELYFEDTSIADRIVLNDAASKLMGQLLTDKALASKSGIPSAASTKQPARPQTRRQAPRTDSKTEPKK